MNRKILSFVFILVILMGLCPLTVMAEEYDSADNWTVIINADGEMESNFSSSISELFAEMQPDDKMVVKITVENQNDEAFDVYMSNKVLQSLEDGTKASGGAYTYVLQYTGPGDSSPTDIFNSDTVGGTKGNDSQVDQPEGMHEATSALEGFFLLDDLDSGEKGVVTLTVTLEGETQGNSYQNTRGDIQISFAAVQRASTPPPNTGYESRLLPMYIIMFVSGTALLIVLITSFRRRNKEEDR